jgi:hypothetical protein
MKNEGRGAWRSCVNRERKKECREGLCEEWRKRLWRVL